MARPIAVVGRFPPPLDGQTLATARMADLVDSARPVVRISTSAPEGERLVSTETRWSWRRTGHYFGVGRRLRRQLGDIPGAPVLWASISPHPLGHARDVLTTLPSFGSDRTVVAVVHRAYFDRMFRSPLTRATAARVVARCAAVVFLTEGLAERAAPFVPRVKRVVIPNTVGADVLCSEAEVSAARADRLRRGGLRLLFLGNLMPEKGYDLALDVAAVLSDRHDIRLDLVGRWPSTQAEATFLQRVEALGMSGRVRVWGGVEHGAVKRFVLDSDLLLFPSTHPSEALPVAVLEAMCAGTPVVGVQHGSLPEVVRDGAGRLTEPSPAALAAAIEEVTRPGSWEVASRAARERFDVAYSPGIVRALWLSLIDRMAGMST